MSNIGILLLLSLASLHAQSYKDLLLAEARHIEGVVVDSEGSPVSGARLDHSTIRLGDSQTDSGGKFKMDTNAPAVVIRKEGFRSVLLQTRPAIGIKVVLVRTGPWAQFPACKKGTRYVGIEEWDAFFRFPKVPGVITSDQGHDIDYANRSYYVKTKKGAKGILHGSGPTWSLGAPLDTDVWQSATYEETSYEFNRFKIADARGKLQNGHRWRYLGRLGESASYSDVDEATARILDNVLDGACWIQK